MSDPSRRTLSHAMLAGIVETPSCAVARIALLMGDAV
jgi:hypothetical protein